MWRVQIHSGPPVILVPFCEYLARLNSTPQPNRKWLPVLGIKPGSLNHESQPLTVRPFLTPTKWYHQSPRWWHRNFEARRFFRDTRNFPVIWVPVIWVFGTLGVLEWIVTDSNHACFTIFFNLWWFGVFSFSKWIFKYYPALSVFW